MIILGIIFLVLFAFITGQGNRVSRTLAGVSSFISNNLLCAGVGVEKREPSYIVGKNVYWYSHDTEQYADSFRN